MKRNLFTFSLSLLLFFVLKAQDTASLAQQDLDYFLQHLDKSRIPTGILYDRSPQFADLDTMSFLINATTDPSVKTNSLHFLQAWSELYWAGYDHSNMIRPKRLSDFITAKRIVNVVPVGVMNYRFNVIDTNSFKNGWLYLGSDTMVYDFKPTKGEGPVFGRFPPIKFSPYLLREIFLASPLVDEVRAGNVTFEIPSNMLLQNNPNGIQAMSVSINGGAFSSFNPGSTFTATLAPGQVVMTFLAQFSNGAVKTISSTLSVRGEQNSATRSGRGTGTANSKIYACNDPGGGDLFPTITATDGFPDYGSSILQFGQIEVGYYYANCNDQTLRKPIIILDGYDPGDERRVSDIYELLNYTIPPQTTPINLGEQLRAQGYDIVVVNFPSVLLPNNDIRDGGADYIERNALSLVTLIRQINLDLAANSVPQEIVIVGPSMGGLISRYALSFMEQQGQNHHCRLWVSFDSPHAGANISIGAQYWLKYYAEVAGKAPAQKNYNGNIQSVAARQLLLDHVDAHSLASSYSSVTPSPLRAQFLANLNSLSPAPSGQNGGFPHMFGIKTVAITNGSGLGVRQPQSGSCLQAVNFQGFSRHWLRGVLFNYLGAAGAVSLRRKVTESNIFLTADYGGTCKAFDGYFSYFIGPHNQYEERFVTTVSNTRSYDLVPGGNYPTFEKIRKDGELSDAFGFTHVTTGSNSHAFIPTASALALQNPTPAFRNLAANLSDRNLVCTGETPFDSYFTANNNEGHVTISPASANWIIAAINSTTTLPPPTTNYDYSYPIEISSGQEPVCSGTTYSIPNLPAGYTVTWRADPPASVTLTPNQATREVTVANNTYPGTVTLYADVVSPCGPFTVNRQFPIGINSTAIIEDLDNNSCYNRNQMYYFRVSNPVPNVSYKWGAYFPDGTFSMFPQSVGTPSLSIMFNQDGYYGIVVVPYNTECGEGNYSEYSAYVNAWGCRTANNAGLDIKTAPNPIHGDVIVTVANATSVSNKETQVERVQIQLFDFFTSKLVKTWSVLSDQKQWRLNVRDVKPGNYILTVTIGTKRTSKQVVVQ